MKQRFIVLNVLQVTPLQLAIVRSILSPVIYIEIDNSFYISCSRAFKDSLQKTLRENDIMFVLVYVQNKEQNDLFTNGVNSNDAKKIEEIVI